jgi:KUP system potassium uptake protein
MSYQRREGVSQAVHNLHGFLTTQPSTRVNDRTNQSLQGPLRGTPTMKTSTVAPSEAHGSLRTHDDQTGFALLVLGSLGVVYGDIGTSPLYALRFSLAHLTHGADVRREVLGVESLLLWALIFTVTAKYVLFIMRMDNKGEGGTLSLMALAQTAMGRRSLPVFLLGIAGASLFYGDAILTPAVSVLSAIEGTEVAWPSMARFVVYITLAIVCLLFFAQSRGTEKVAKLFGPIMLLWFSSLALLGLAHISEQPSILVALNPYYAVRYLVSNGFWSFLIFGAVVLAVTGGEALYADMGHFGRKPITTAWIGLVLPALVLNYLGQGAMVLARPETLSDPFYLMVPPWALVPMILLATAATVIASQAVISGTYSLTQQAIQLGLVPRLQIKHTSETLAGQIFLPRVNMILFFGVVALVMIFRNSDSLLSAYGIAVCGAMTIDTLLAFIVVWKFWQWPLPWAIAICLPFSVVDALFLSANSFKFLDGGYLPITFGAVLMIIMWTWARGVRLVNERQRRESVPLEGLMKSLSRSKPTRVPGTAVYLTTTPDSAPSALLHNLKHYRVLHEQNVVLTIKAAGVPRVPLDDQLKIERIDDSMVRIIASIGFMQTPDVPRLLLATRKYGLQFDIMQTSFFLSRFNLKSSAMNPLVAAQDQLFIMLTRLANDATDFMKIPPGRVVWLGGQLTL